MSSGGRIPCEIITLGFILKTDLLSLFHSNRKFAESYTKDLNGATIDEFKDIANKIYVNAKRPLFKMKQNEPNAQCLEIFFRTSDLGHSLFSLLRDVFEQNCNPINDDADFTPKSGAFFKMFEKLFDELKTGSDEMKTFALKSERAFDVFFDSEIVRPREFKFLTEGSDRVQPDTKSMLIFDQFFPFNNKNHVDTNCVPVEELPLFYKNKGSHRWFGL